MESNKTEILSFDDALNEHKRLLTESLVNFNEGQRVRKIMLDIDSNSADYEYYFQAGQQSKQSEVEELQKKIDEAISCLEKNKPSLKMNYRHAMNALSILKGDQS